MSTTIQPEAETPAASRAATLRLRRIHPWSAMKTGFVFSTGLGIMYVVAALLLFVFSSGAGLFDSFNSTFADLSGEDGLISFSFGQVAAVVTVFAIVEVVIMTLLFAVFAMLYNAAAMITGGVKTTLAED